MQVQPYLFFDGRCDEALDFYKKAIGADVKMLMRFKDCSRQVHAQPGLREQGHACAVSDRRDDDPGIRRPQ